MPLTIPPGELMVPGQTYIGVLPGDRKPSFVRKRPECYRDRSTFGQVLSNVFTPRRQRSRSNKMNSWSRLDYYDSDYVYDNYPSRHRHYTRRRRIPVFPLEAKDPRTAKHSCAACGKFRSPAWSARHPLLPGEVPKPGLCRSCRGKSTSSEESPCDHRGRKRHADCHQRVHSHKHDCSGDSSEDFYRSHRRHRHYSPDSYSRPSRGLGHASSRESVNVIIDNSSRPQRRPTVVSETTTSTEEELEIVRKTVPRSRSKTSYVIEDVENRSPRRKRSTSSVRIVRNRSHRRPHYVEEPEGWPRRRRHRSGSHVSFMDEPEEIRMSRSKSSSRRPHVYYDGANSGEHEQQDPIASSSASRNHSIELSDEARLIESRLKSFEKRIGSSNSSQQTLDNVDLSTLRLDPMPSSIDETAAAQVPSTTGVENLEEVLPFGLSSEQYSEKPAGRIRGQRRHSDLSLQTKYSSVDQPSLRQPYSEQNVPLPRTAETHAKGMAHPGMRPKSPMYPDNPAHPDHMAWLIASDLVTPIQRPDGGLGFMGIQESFGSTADTEPLTPTDNRFDTAWIRFANDRYLEDHENAYTRPFYELDDDEYEIYQLEDRQLKANQRQEDIVERRRLENAYLF